VSITLAFQAKLIPVFKDFVYLFDRESVHKWGDGQREREKQTPH